MGPGCVFYVVITKKLFTTLAKEKTTEFLQQPMELDTVFFFFFFILMGQQSSTEWLCQ